MVASREFHRRGPWTLIVYERTVERWWMIRMLLYLRWSCTSLLIFFEVPIEIRRQLIANECIHTSCINFVHCTVCEIAKSSSPQSYILCICKPVDYFYCYNKTATIWRDAVPTAPCRLRSTAKHTKQNQKVYTWKWKSNIEDGWNVDYTSYFFCRRAHVRKTVWF